MCIRIINIREEQWKLLDNYRRKMYVKYEMKNKLFKSIIRNKSLPISYRYYATFQKSLVPKSSSIVKQVNRCVQSGRQWNILKKVKLSRFVFRFQSYDGILPGVRRSSW